MTGPHDIFISYDPDSASQVKKLSAALAAIGVTSFAYDGGNARELHPKLATCKLLIGWGSTGFFNSRSCQTHLATTFLAQKQNPFIEKSQRILIINPESGFKHIYPMALREMALTHDKDEDADFSVIANRVRSDLDRIHGNIGNLYTEAAGGWLEPFDRLTQPPKVFVSRDRELWDIFMALDKSDNPSTKIKPVVISGAAGHGKTFLAREYAFRFAAAYPGGIFRITAQDALPVASLAQLRRNPALKCQLRALFTKAFPDIVLETDIDLINLRARFCKCLTERQGTYLWIVDNVPEGINGPALEQWFAPTYAESQLGHTILISRSNRYDSRGEPIHVPILDPESSVLLLQNAKNSQKNEEENSADWLVEDLGRHPRFIAMCSHFVSERFHGKRSAYSTLSQRIAKKNKLAQELSINLGEDLPVGQGLACSNLFIDVLHSLPQPAKNLLILATQLSDQPAPSEFIEQCLLLSGLSLSERKEDLFTIFLNEPQEEPATHEAARIYLEKGSISLELYGLAEKNDGSLIFNPSIVRAVDKVFGDSEKKVLFREAALQAIYVIAENASNDSSNWLPLAAVSSHGQKLIDDLKERTIDPEDTASEITGRIRLAFHLAELDLGNDATERAIKLLRASSAYLVRAMSVDPHNHLRQRDFAKVQEQLGQLSEASGNLTTALDHYRKSLGVRSFMSKQSTFSAEHLLDNLRLHSQIGKILVQLEDIEGGLQSYRAAHVICVRLSQESSDDLSLRYQLAESYQKIGELYSRLQDPEHALSALNQALELFESLVEVDPEDYRYLIAPAAVHGLIGDLLKAKDDLSGALKRFKTALDVSRFAARNLLGDAQAQRKIAIYLNKLGDTLNGLDDHPAAKQHYLEFLEIAKNPQNRSAFSGQRQRDIAVVEIKLGLVAEGNKEANEAIRRYQSARALIERLAVDFPENEILREDLGWLKRKLERLIERRDADIRRQLRETQRD